LVLRSENGQLQATITAFDMNAAASLDDFKLICQTRLDAEKQGLEDGFVTPDPPQPFQEGTAFGMYYYGGEKKTGRVFYGYLSMLGNNLTTIYVEGFAVSPEMVGESFTTFVRGLR
jgi:hypothetical protein